MQIVHVTHFTRSQTTVHMQSTCGWSHKLLIFFICALTVCCVHIHSVTHREYTTVPLCVHEKCENMDVVFVHARCLSLSLHFWIASTALSSGGVAITMWYDDGPKRMPALVYRRNITWICWLPGWLICSAVSSARRWNRHRHTTLIHLFIYPSKHCVYAIRFVWHIVDVITFPNKAHAPCDTNAKYVFFNKMKITNLFVRTFCEYSLISRDPPTTKINGVLHWWSEASFQFDKTIQNPGRCERVTR